MSENIVEKNACNQHFLIFLQCFLPYERVTLNLSSVNTLNLDKAENAVKSQGKKKMA